MCTCLSHQPGIWESVALAHLRIKLSKVSMNSLSVLLSLFLFVYISPGKIRTLSLEASSCPSLYQVSVGGGTALVSQYREMGLLSITSRTSPPKPGEDAVSPSPPGLLKLGGTEKRKRKRRETFKLFFEHFFKRNFKVWLETQLMLWLCIYLKRCWL